MRYTLKEPIPYRTLSGVNMLYDCLNIETDKNNHTSLTMTTVLALSPRLEVTLTVPDIKAPHGLVVLKQNEKCTEISRELVRRGILIPVADRPAVRSGFVDYMFYRIERDYLLKKEKNIS